MRTGKKKTKNSNRSSSSVKGSASMRGRRGWVKEGIEPLRRSSSRSRKGRWWWGSVGISHAPLIILYIDNKNIYIVIIIEIDNYELLLILLLYDYDNHCYIHKRRSGSSESVGSSGRRKIRTKTTHTRQPTTEEGGGARRGEGRKKVTYLLVN